MLKTHSAFKAQLTKIENLTFLSSYLCMLLELYASKLIEVPRDVAFLQ